MAELGQGFGALTIDPHPERDYLYTGHNNTFKRYYRDGTPINLWHDHVVHLPNGTHVTSGTCVTDKTGNIRYASLDATLKLILVLNPDYVGK